MTIRFGQALACFRATTRFLWVLPFIFVFLGGGGLAHRDTHFAAFLLPTVTWGTGILMPWWLNYPEGKPGPVWVAEDAVVIVARYKQSTTRGSGGWADVIKMSNKLLHLTSEGPQPASRQVSRMPRQESSSLSPNVGGLLRTIGGAPEVTAKSISFIHGPDPHLGRATIRK